MSDRQVIHFACRVELDKPLHSSERRIMLFELGRCIVLPDGLYVDTDDGRVWIPACNVRCAWLYPDKPASTLEPPEYRDRSGYPDQYASTLEPKPEPAKRKRGRPRKRK